MAAAIAGALGIIGALHWEMDVFSARPPGGPGWLLETCGPGPAAATAGAERAVTRGAACLVSWGTAGALRAGEPGDIVLPDRISDGPCRDMATDKLLTDWLARACQRIAPVRRGALVSVPAPVTSVAAKRALAESSGAIAVDMESAAIGAVAGRSGLPLIVVRVIVDSSDIAVPAAAVAGMDGPRTRPGRVLAGLLKSPLETGGIIALGLAARRARRTLRACVPVLASLGAEPPA